MSVINSHILTIDKAICDNIARFSNSERGLLSQNLLAQLRNFVDHISLKILSPANDIENSYANIKAAEHFIETRGDLRFLRKFHDLLQKSASHYTLDEENSERLMLKYLEYLLKIKSYLKKHYGLEVLHNIQQFPLKVDSAMNEYHQKIADKIDHPQSGTTTAPYSDRYYIQKIKPFFVNQQVYYEVTFTTAIDNASKFDRVIAFTKLDIASNYAAKLQLTNDVIEVFGKHMPIRIIEDWHVSIRPCEFDNFADIFGSHARITTGTIEYRALMTFIKDTGLSLVEIINLSDDHYQSFKITVAQKAQTTHILPLLDKCRELTQAKAPGSNVVQYLLHSLNNRIIKQQYSSQKCNLLSDLRMGWGCIPFDKMPYTTSLLNHNPRLGDLFDSINPTGREHELFARHIKNNVEIKANLYTPQISITSFTDLDGLITAYNEKLYWKHGKRKLQKYKEHIYIKGYEEDTSEIIKRLKKLSGKGVKNFSKSVDSWLRSSAYTIDCEEKKSKLKVMFENSEVAFVYGSAGTGKSTLINHISNFFHDRTKLYLANTNPAVENLRRKVNAGNSTYCTVTRFLSQGNESTEYDLIVIDECSTLSNADMLRVLDKATFKLLLLVGDVFQIESIRFGNWFGLAQRFIPSTAVFELTTPYRSNNPKLLDLWDKVRNCEDDTLEHITRNNYSIALDESVFDHAESDEIILCLNYDGLYGINNINKFLQESNPGSMENWGVQTYKINDPILFNESKRFTPVVYNNLKGRIVGLKNLGSRIEFDIEVDKAINEIEAQGQDFEVLDGFDTENSVIRFSVNKLKSTDEDEDSSAALVPFQVAYAVSIHKAQGLEYDSVKVVITDEIEEMISHNIFYTAITRAREKLKVYWTPETEKEILSSFNKVSNRGDAGLLSSKFNL